MSATTSLPTGEWRLRSPRLRLAALLAVSCLACSRGEPDTTNATSGSSDDLTGDGPLLTEITSQLGLDTEPVPWPDGTYFMPEITGPGVALFDADGDGRLDILQLRTPRPGERDQPAPNRLFRQQPDGSFEDATQATGLGDPGFGQGVAVGDVDNDGDLDVYVLNYGADAFYLNQGDGSFVARTKEAGFSGERWGSSATFCDYDRDGFLDLYIAHYVRLDYDGPCRSNSGTPEFCGPATYDGEPDALYRNNGDGTFTDVTEAAALRLPDPTIAKGLGVVCVDMTGDAWPDVYVANDGEANQLWVNQQDGTFSDQALIRGVAFNRHGKAEASMGVAVGELNADDKPDLLLTHLTLENNTLYMSDPGKLFADRTVETQLSAHDLHYTGFGCGFLDYDHDGDLDLAVVNGEVRLDPADPTARETASFWQRYAEPNLLFENGGEGSFDSVGDRGRRFTTRVEVSRALALGDLDNDGDLDLVSTNVDNSMRVYRNDAADPAHHWVQIRALTLGRDAIGARVALALPGGGRRVGFVLSGYSYQAANDLRVHFGLGPVGRVEAIEVLWPDGRLERFDAPGVDQVLTIVQGTGHTP